MKRSGFLRRHTPIRRKGKSRFPRRRCQPYLDWLKAQACRITGKRTGDWFSWLPLRGFRTVYYPFQIVVDPMHVKSRGAGGQDLWNALSVAHHLHEESHRIGVKSFAKKYGVNLEALAAEQTRQWLDTSAGRAWLVEHPEQSGVIWGASERGNPQ